MRTEAERGRPPKHRTPARSPRTVVDLSCLAGEISGRRVLVMGSGPIDVQTRANALLGIDYLIAVNGSISTLDEAPNLWLVNSRIDPLRRWTRAKGFLHTTMMEQARGRHVGTVGLLTRQEGAAPWTLGYLEELRCTSDRVLEISRTDRERLETESGARTVAMRKDACSAGVFAVIVALWAGARSVRMEGFSYAGGYEYLPGHVLPPNSRAHVQGDRLALRELTTRYPGQITGALVPGSRRREMEVA